MNFDPKAPINCQSIKAELPYMFCSDHIKQQVQFLLDEIEALTMTGRQGELEQANTGLAVENARMREAFEEILLWEESHPAMTLLKRICYRGLGKEVPSTPSTLQGNCEILIRAPFVSGFSEQDARQEIKNLRGEVVDRLPVRGRYSGKLVLNNGFTEKQVEFHAEEIRVSRYV